MSGSLCGLLQKVGLYSKTMLSARDAKSLCKALLVKMEDELCVERLGWRRRIGAKKWDVVNFDISFYCDNVTVSVYYEVFGARAYTFFRGFVPCNDDIVVDLGANEGIFTCYAAKRAPCGRVYAVEPDSDNLGWLKANLELNHVANVTVVPKCIGQRTGRAFFRKGPTSGTGCVVEAREPDGDITEVDQITLADLMNEFRIPRIDLLKIDVEGSEVGALSGAGDQLARVRRIALEYHSPLLANQVEKLLGERGFSELREPSAARSHILYFENDALCRSL